MTDNTVRLHYFNGRGLAHIIRYTLAAAGVEYIEQTIATPEQLQDLQEQGLLYWQQLPLLQIDGRNLVQSNAIVSGAYFAIRWCVCSHFGYRCGIWLENTICTAQMTMKLFSLILSTMVRGEAQPFFEQQRRLTFVSFIRSH